jgi:hypothetical protein
MSRFAPTEVHLTTAHHADVRGVAVTRNFRRRIARPHGMALPVLIPLAALTAGALPILVMLYRLWRYRSYRRFEHLQLCRWLWGLQGLDNRQEWLARQLGVPRLSILLIPAIVVAGLVLAILAALQPYQHLLPGATGEMVSLEPPVVARLWRIACALITAGGVAAAASVIAAAAATRDVLESLRSMGSPLPKASVGLAQWVRKQTVFLTLVVAAVPLIGPGYFTATVSAILFWWILRRFVVYADANARQAVGRAIGRRDRETPGS